MTPKAEFHNKLRSLFNISDFRLSEFSSDQLRRFDADPVRFFLRGTESETDAIWREIERRQVWEWADV
jgi:hypothetical protein